MVDFNKMLEQELNKFKQEDNNTSDTQDEPLRRAHEIINVNKRSPFVGRILPLKNKWFAKEISRVWVEYTKSDGTTKVTPIIIDEDDPEDEFAKLVVSIIKYNAQMKREKNEDSVIKLNSRERGNFHIDHKYEVIGIPLLKTDNGVQLAKSQDGGYRITNYLIPQTGYRHILDIINDKSYGIRGKQFDTPLGFITKGLTFPIKIMFDGSLSYSVNARPDIILPAIQYDYEAKDKNGNFLYFDDPEVFSDTTLHTNPGFYQFVLGQVKKKVEPILGVGNQSTVSVVANPYKDNQATKDAPVAPTPVTPEAPTASVAPVESTPVAPTAPVTPVASKISDSESTDDVLDSSEDVDDFLDKINEDLPF